MNAIYWHPRALKQMRRLPGADGKNIRAAVDEGLVDLERARNVKALAGHKYGYRLRVGRYRVFFDYDGRVQVVGIEEVRKRDERTY